MLVYGKCECFVMQMLYICVFCAFCGSTQCCVFHDSLSIYTIVIFKSLSIIFWSVVFSLLSSDLYNSPLTTYGPAAL